MGKDGADIATWIHSPGFQPYKVPRNVRICSYKFSFDCSNIETEYEALIARSKIINKMNAKRISVYGYSKLIIKKFKGEYQAKHQ